MKTCRRGGGVAVLLRNAEGIGETPEETVMGACFLSHGRVLQKADGEALDGFACG
jgi:hypothetical protein